MRRVVVGLLAGTLIYAAGCYADAYAQHPSAEEQIAAAVKAAPARLQAGARVLGYSSSGRLVTLREGSNYLVCLADDPSDDGFHVACYHVGLEPFMARGRHLRSEGMSRSAVDSSRLAEIRSGQLAMPERPTALYSLSGSSSDSGSGVPPDAVQLHVVYVPYATGESTGLPTRPAEGKPWLMEPGMPWAHIMISVGSE